MPFVIGSPRSGTTLLRLMLDAHSDMAIPPETGFFMSEKIFSDDREKFFSEITTYPSESPNWGDFHVSKEHFHAEIKKLRIFNPAEGLRAFYRVYAERFSKKRWGDKTPLHGLHMRKIQDILPEARFIHIIRDGRDAAVSLRKQWFSPGYDIEVQAGYWRNNILTMHEEGRQTLHYLEIRYEDLVNQPEDVLKKICVFLEMDFQNEMLRYYEKSPARIQEHLARYRMNGSVIVSQTDRYHQQISTTKPLDASLIGRWKDLLSKEEIHNFDVAAGDVLREYGY